MLNGILGEQLLNFLIFTQELEGWLDNAVEDKGKVHQEGETQDLEPLECFPAQAQGDNPNEQGSACIDGRSCCSTDTSSN